MELNKKETICTAYHMMNQHRQAIFERTASIYGLCEKCPYCAECKTEHFKQWTETYIKLCESAGVKTSFCEGEFPLIPYDTEFMS